MENTCVLHDLPVIPKWKVYNLPQIKPVEYYSILKQKREFQGLLKQALVEKYLKTGSCSIVSKHNPFFENEKNINIIFISEINILSLTLRIQERHALKRRNNILIYLKNISNDITYEIKNDRIYTKCEENIKWKIFYSLFEFLLLRYGTSIIGAIFYNYVTLDHILMNEKTLLYLLTVQYRSSLKPNSKLSQQNPHVCTENDTFRHVERNQNFSINSLRFEKSCVPSLSQNYISAVSNLSVKRKAVEDIQPNCKLFKQDFSDRGKGFSMKRNCECHKSRWEVFRNIETCNVDSYMDILLSKGVLCDTEFSDSLNDGLDSFQGEPLVNEDISVSSHQTDEGDKCNIISQKQLPKESVKLMPSKEFQNEESESNVDSYMDILLSKGVLCDTEFSDSLTKGLDSIQEEPLVNENISASLHQTDKCNVISQKQLPEQSAKLVPSKAFENEERNFMSKNTKKDISVQNIALDIKIEERVKEQTGSNNLPSCSSKNIGLGKVIRKEDISTLFSEFIDEEIPEANCSFSMFTTAGGKQVKISETALKSAEKMFCDVLTSEETADFEMETLDKSTFKTDYKNKIQTPVYKPSHFPKQPNIKTDIEETIDGALAEKMFEEISFDEKEIDTGSEALCVPSLPSASNVNERMVSCGKVRKSLGGRRSLKPYSIPNA